LFNRFARRASGEGNDYGLKKKKKKNKVHGYTVDAIIVASMRNKGRVVLEIRTYTLYFISF